MSILCLGRLQACPAGGVDAGAGGTEVAGTGAGSSVHATAEADSITPLEIGDRIPEELWEMAFPVVSPHADNVQYLSLGDFRDKLIILDFWATWCAPCISSLYKLDTLQREFAGDLLVFPTSYEAQDKVSKFFADKGWDLPTAFDETQLKKYFPHRIIPHQVWLKDGEVLAVTNSAAASSGNISRVLKGEAVRTVEKSERVGFDKREPLLVPKDGLEGVPVLYSTGFTPYIDGVAAGISRTDSSINIFNVPVVQFYRIAHADTINHLEQYNRVILDVPAEKRDRLTAPADLRLTGEYDNDRRVYEWMGNNHYSYAAVFPSGTSNGERSRSIKEDVNDFFGLLLGVQGGIEVRPVKCIVFRSGDATVGHTGQKGKMVPIGSFMYRVAYENRRAPTPVIDEVGDRDGLTLPEPADYTDLEKLEAHLAPYGIDVSKEYREIPVLVISETNKL